MRKYRIGQEVLVTSNPPTVGFPIGILAKIVDTSGVTNSLYPYAVIFAGRIQIFAEGELSHKTYNSAVMRAIRGEK